MTDSVTEHMIVGVGGAHLDRIGHVGGEPVAGASNPGRMIETVGGGMLNALRMARLRGTPAMALCSVRGGDGGAIAVEQAIADSGLHDLSGTFLDRMTASYTAIHGPDGDVITALADMDIYESALPRHVRRKPIVAAFQAAQCLMIDANIPAPSLAETVTQANGCIAAMAISAAKVSRLREAGPMLDIVFANTREAGAFADTQDLDATLNGLRLAMPKAVLVISDGPHSVTIAMPGQADMTLTPAPVDVIDVTGAGDALTGGTMAALATDAFDLTDPDSIRNAVLSGMACSACALGQTGPISTPDGLNAYDTHLAALKAANTKEATP